MKLVGVGVGPGDPEHITLKALRALREADRVFVPDGGRAAEIVTAHVPVEPLGFAMTDAASRAEHWDRAGAAIAEVARTGTAAFATIGDPNLYSTFTYVAHTVRALLPEVEVETVPGITAMQDLASRTGTILAEGSETLALVPYTAGHETLERALESFDTVVVYKGGRHLQRVLEVAGERAVYGEELGRPGQTLVAPEGAGPYMSTVIVPARREGRGERI